MNKALLSYCFLTSVLVAFAQQSPCKDKLESALTSLQEIEEPDQGKNHLFRLEVITTKRQESFHGKISKSNLGILISENEYYYKNEQLSFLITGEDQFILLHPKQLIIKSAVDKDAAKVDLRRNLLIGSQDELLKNGSIISCESNETNLDETIRIRPDEDFLKIHKIREMKFTINSNCLIKEVEVSYSNKHKLKNMRVIYKEVELNIPSSETAFKQDILLSSGEFSKQYRNYKLIAQQP